MKYGSAVSPEWITTTGRPHADRCRLDVYPIVEAKEARWGDMDVNGHLNHLALESLHEDARARINKQYLPGTYDLTKDTFRLVTSQNIIPTSWRNRAGPQQSRQASESEVSAIARLSSPSCVCTIEDRCISVCDMTLVLIGDEGPVAFPEKHREAMRKLMLRAVSRH